MPDDALAAAATVTSRLECAILGKFTEDGEERVVRVLCTKTTYANGDWYIAFNDVDNPLSGDAISGTSDCFDLGAMLRSMAAVSGGELRERVRPALPTLAAAMLLIVSVWVLCEFWPCLFAGYGLRGIVG